MKYFYFPSTFFGRKKKGGGYMVGGYIGSRTLGSMKQVNPSYLPKSEKAIVHWAESKSQPVQIGKKRWKYWNSLKKTGKTVWNGTKELSSLAGNAATLYLLYRTLSQNPNSNPNPNPNPVPEPVIEKIEEEKKGISPDVYVNLASALITLISNFYGNGGAAAVGALGGGRRKRRNWLVKGSKEAKAYMAKLRAMRKNN